jgi:hypothetical protein
VVVLGVGGLGVSMPRQVAFKDPKWTGRIIWVGEYNEFGELSGSKCLVRIDGVVRG